ncbi:hypothetical protein LLH23_00525 [bacterium]|nr:hypothetical protein [bacterium]
MTGWTVTVCLALLVGALVWAEPLDQTRLVAEYKAADLAYKDGKGLSESADSGSLGWGEASYLRNYSRMWLVTRDPYWLGKIEDHFTRIMANATDPDGDGFQGWQTATYSGAVYWCLPLHNRGAATIEPGFFKETGKLNTEVTGHVYVLSFDGPAVFSIQDQTTRKALADKQPYKPGAVITAIPGCKVKISGEAAVGDRFMVRTMQPEPTEFTVHEGMIAYPVAIFIEAVKQDAKLQERFGASADRFLAFINQHMLRKHEADWLEWELPGNGVLPPTPSLKGRGTAGAWRFRDLITDRFPNRIMPHNQYLALARAFLVLKDVPGADPLMGQRAEQMARFFRASLIEQDAAFTWRYWDWVENGQPDHSGFEDTSHGTIDVGFAIEAATRGLVFTDADMKRFARTMLDLMWNQSEEDPKLGPNCATRGDKFGFVLGDWLDLCRWEPRIYALALKTYAAKMSPSSAPLMLHAEKLCGTASQK